MLSQLIYVSHRNSNCTEDEIEKIVSSCKKNNSPLDLTGVLLYSDSKFIQLLEGNSKTLIGLYDKIKLDNRHSKSIMICYGFIKERAFPSWHMGNRHIEGSRIDFKTNISKEEETLFNNVLNGEKEEGTKVLDLLKKFF